MHKKRENPGQLTGRLLQNTFWSREEIVPTEPVMHINCRGCAELENCSAILEYEPEKIRFRVGKTEVEIVGEQLTIVLLRTSATQISGKIHHISFTEASADGRA